ncbi:MAG: hypothetical protein D6711_04320 [Chloroflexi bacterium]|nr:MAG: hypothetical protein D6711_04320 [Chloroflexota bacterium]
MLHDNQQALARYNSLFDNQQYKAIAHSIADDLRVERDSTKVVDHMNAITDVALSISGHSHYTDAAVKLAALCGQNGISIATIDRIYTYLLIYQQPGDTTADDFQLTAKALLKAYELSDPLKAAVSCTNGVHGWRGRMAYQLFAASDYLVQAAVQLLIDGNLSYIREKLHHGLQRLTGALHEAVRHSPRPDRFDFSEIVFPSDPDRQ